MKFIYNGVYFMAEFNGEVSCESGFLHLHRNTLECDSVDYYEASEPNVSVALKLNSNFVLDLLNLKEFYQTHRNTNQHIFFHNLEKELVDLNLLERDLKTVFNV